MGTPPRGLLLDLAGVLADFDREHRLDRLAAGELGADEVRAELVGRRGLPDDADLDELWASAFTTCRGASPCSAASTRHCPGVC